LLNSATIENASRLEPPTHGLKRIEGVLLAIRQVERDVRINQDDAGLQDYQSFTRLFGIEAAPNQMVRIGQHERISIYATWVRHPVSVSE